MNSEFEKNEFVIDVLGPGSILFYRSFFLRDVSEVSIVAKTSCRVKRVHLDRVTEIMRKFPDEKSFSTRFQIAQNKFLKSDTRYLLDYIPRNLRKEQIN